MASSRARSALKWTGPVFGMGQRSQRFGLIIEDGAVKKTFVEAPGEFKVSSAEHMMENI